VDASYMRPLMYDPKLMDDNRIAQSSKAGGISLHTGANDAGNNSPVRGGIYMYQAKGSSVIRRVFCCPSVLKQPGRYQYPPRQSLRVPASPRTSDTKQVLATQQRGRVSSRPVEVCYGAYLFNYTMPALRNASCPSKSGCGRRQRTARQRKYPVDCNESDPYLPGLLGDGRGGHRPFYRCWKSRPVCLLRPAVGRSQK